MTNGESNSPLPLPLIEFSLLFYDKFWQSRISKKEIIKKRSVTINKMIKILL